MDYTRISDIGHSPIIARGSDFLNRRLAKDKHRPHFGNFLVFVLPSRPNPKREQQDGRHRRQRHYQYRSLKSHVRRSVQV